MFTRALVSGSKKIVGVVTAEVFIINHDSPPIAKTRATSICIEYFIADIDYQVLVRSQSKWIDAYLLRYLFGDIMSRHDSTTSRNLTTTQS